MGNVVFKPNSGALKSIMQSGEVASQVNAKALSICSTANSIGRGSYIMKSGVGKVSARAVVVTGNYEAIRDNAKNNTLLKSIG